VLEVKNTLVANHPIPPNDNINTTGHLLHDQHALTRNGDGTYIEAVTDSAHDPNGFMGGSDKNRDFSIGINE
jgi:hypothetical protein